MKIGYIITAHTLPEHLVRLVRRLATDDARFFLHIDSRAPEEVMSTVERELGGRPDVRLLPRHPVHWASFGPVRAALEGVDALLAWPERLDYGVLLTGQDYPLRSPAEIESTLAAAGGRSFITYRRPEGRFLRRLTRWHWHGTVMGRRVRLPNRFMPLTARRRLPPGLLPYTGSAHWCLSRDCLEHVARADPELVRFFRRSAVPDESFFQTLLMNSPLAGTLVNDDLRYVDWSEGGPSPRVLTSYDLERMVRSSALFARKFDPRVDAAVIDALDAHIDKTRAVA
ncbi:MAG TPA: beta-1,6-N-acetylglucosaminyltransferase [Thermoleophilaceae bacterium]|nr:beta-1,6-N-acetylglucosaminyltransferase [Thermoleophilaceae bacterium]